MEIPEKTKISKLRRKIAEQRNKLNKYHFHPLKEESIKDFYKRRHLKNTRVVSLWKYITIVQTHEILYWRSRRESSGRLRRSHPQYKLKLSEKCIEYNKELYNKLLSTKQNKDLDEYRHKKLEVNIIVTRKDKELRQKKLFT